MFDFLKKTFRLKTRELEANLHPVAGCTFGGKGEVEICWYSDGTTKIELSLKHSGIPDGTPIEYHAGRVLLGAAAPQGGYLKVHETREGQDGELGAIVVGSKAEIRVNGAVQYEGQFRPD